MSSFLTSVSVAALADVFVYSSFLFHVIQSSAAYTRCNQANCISDDKTDNKNQYPVHVPSPSQNLIKPSLLCFTLFPLMIVCHCS